MGKINVVFGNERILPASGQALVGQLLTRSELCKEADRLIISGHPEPQIPNHDVVLTYMGLLTQGITDFEGVKLLLEDSEAATLNLGLSWGVPSESTLRQRMNAMGQNLRGVTLRTNTQVLRSSGVVPSANEQGYVPVDVDVTPMDNSDTKKQGVSRTYAGYDGYAPNVAYMGAEGYMANIELREGKQHCQKGTPDFLWESIQQAKAVVEKGAKILVRLDSGNDAAENIGVCLDNGVDFLIKRNLRRETTDEWEFNALTAEFLDCGNAQVITPREGKVVRTGSMLRKIPVIHADGRTTQEKVRIIYEVTERTILANGQICALPMVSVNTWWTSLKEDEATVIELYHAHGECEQYHAELKSDMGVERLPSGKFATNALVVELAMLAFNLLRMIGQECLKANDAPLKRKVKRRRLGTVIKHMICIAGHMTKHARKVFVALGRSNPWRDAFARVATAFG